MVEEVKVYRPGIEEEAPDSLLSLGLEGLRAGLRLRGAPEPGDWLSLAKVAFPWEWAPYQEEILHRLIEGDDRRLLILAPPRHRKTSLVAFYAAWMLGLHPEWRLMVGSHSRDYSALVLDLVENIMRLPAYIRRFGRLFPVARSESRWTTFERHIPGRPACTKDPSMIALSPESGTPGYGAELIIVDDLVTPANAFTPGARNRLHMWFYSSLLHRLEPTGKIVVIGARWFQDDLYGVLLSEGWPHLVYRATPDAPLWPSHWPAEALREQADRDPVFFSAQYCQEPRDLSRAILSGQWLHYYVQRPDNLAIYCGLDPAITGSGSRFAYVVVGRDPAGFIYVIEGYSNYHTPNEMPAIIDSVYNRWTPVAFAWESNGPQAAEMDLLARLLKTPARLVPIPSLLSKPIRMQSLAGLARAGQLSFPGVMRPSGDFEPAASIQPLIEAWKNFPAGDVDLLDALEKAVSLARQGPPPAWGKASPPPTLTTRRPSLDHFRSFPRFIHGAPLTPDGLKPED